MSDINKLVAKACKSVSNHDGLKIIHRSTDREHEIVTQGRVINSYLLVAVLAERLASGDIEIKDISDKCGRKAYFDKLVKSLET